MLLSWNEWNNLYLMINHALNIKSILQKIDSDSIKIIEKCKCDIPASLNEIKNILDNYIDFIGSKETDELNIKKGLSIEVLFDLSYELSLMKRMSY